MLAAADSYQTLRLPVAGRRERAVFISTRTILIVGLAVALAWALSWIGHVLLLILTLARNAASMRRMSPGMSSTPTRSPSRVPPWNGRASSVAPRTSLATGPTPRFRARESPPSCSSSTSRPSASSTALRSLPGSSGDRATSVPGREQIDHPYASNARLISAAVRDVAAERGSYFRNKRAPGQQHVQVHPNHADVLYGGASRQTPG